MSTKPTPDDLLARIRGGDRFVITSHVNPDGDAIGSSLGLARLVRKLGKGALVWIRDEVPPIYRPLPGSDRIHTGAEAPAGFPGKFDAWVVMECPGPDRTGLEEHLEALPILNVDHHMGNQLYGAVNWIDPSAPAVGEMVFRLAESLKLDLDAETADLLYMTVVSDTGSFRFANATEDAFEAAAALVRAGARPPRVSQWLYESQPVGAVRLLGEMLSTLELHAGGRIASVRLTLDMFERADAGPGDTEGLIDVPRSIAGVEAVVLFRQRPDDTVKVSLRSHGEVDVERIARRHDGGGHKNAAGCSVAGFGEPERQVLDELEAALAGTAAEPESAEAESTGPETDETDETGAETDETGKADEAAGSAG